MSDDFYSREISAATTGETGTDEDLALMDEAGFCLIGYESPIFGFKAIGAEDFVAKIDIYASVFPDFERETSIVTRFAYSDAHYQANPPANGHEYAIWQPSVPDGNADGDTGYSAPYWRFRIRKEQGEAHGVVTVRVFAREI